MSNLINKVVNKVFHYFDLGSEIRIRHDVGQTGTGGNNNVYYFFHYLIFAAGITVQPFLEKFRQTGQWDLAGWQGWTCFALLVGLCLFPLVYKKAFNAENPKFIQLCSVFGMGVGWQALISTVPYLTAAVTQTVR